MQLQPRQPPLVHITGQRDDGVIALMYAADDAADPAKGSNHARGAAVDLTLINASGQALDMGTPVNTLAPAP
jgi:D-alanyl-D-alanine dipeptidase